MGQYLSPGVYVEEKSSGEKPMEGVGTSTGAFVGIAEKGPIGKAELIANWTQFINKFGGYIADGDLAYAVNQFFAEGGTRCFVVRTCHYTSITDKNSKMSAPATATLLDSGGNPSMRVQGWDGTYGNYVADPKAGISIDIKTATELSGGFQIIVKYKDVEVEIFDNIEMKTVEDQINKKSSFIQVEKDSWGIVIGSGIIPAVIASVQLTGGNDGLTGLNSTDFLGDESSQTGLHAFDVIDDINIVAMPDRAGDRTAIIGGLNYCQNRKDCFFIADPPKGCDPMTVDGFKKGTIAPYIGNAFNNSYGALYYPWVIINDPRTGRTRDMPPSGAVAGTYAHTDTVRGVHKAPAGIIEGYLDSVSGIERIITKSEHDGLNPGGINVIRSFPTSGICIWGARTLSADPEWRYLNIRRLFLFLEESIDKGSQWVVFEPNSPALWGSVKRNLTAFLLRVWRDGALFGSTPEEAFFVKVDAENNPEEVRNAGQLIIDVGVAPVRPAEFVIIRITQKTQSK
jgi:hypothetical protein